MQTVKIVRNMAFAAVSAFAAATADCAEYSLSAGQSLVLSGAISEDVSISAPSGCEVTLSSVSMAGTLSISGDATLTLEGSSSISTSGATAIACDGALTLSGDGSLAASGAGAKKTGVITAADLSVAGGATTVTIANPTKKNACGVSLSGNYTQLAGSLKIVGTSEDYKQNGVFLSAKNTSATVSGGTLDVTLAGEKSVGLALDKASCSAVVSGGSLVFSLSGDGAKGVKGDGTFTMTGGSLSATLSGGAAEDYFEYEDGDGNTWNYYVTLTSSTKTSGGTASYSTSSLIANGTYPVMDPSKCYAVKAGTIAVSGGDIYVRATGTAGRGLGADSMTLSGGTYDIAVSGGPTDVYVESLVDSDNLDDATYATGVTTCLDSGSAACIKTGDSDGTLAISGGTFSLMATGDAGKLINAAGYLVIGAEGQTTLPTDSSFAPDISGSTTGSKVYCSAVKQKYYGSLATATATGDISSLSLSSASENVVKSSSASGIGFGGGFGGGPGGMAAGGDDDADYSNPKGIKGVAGVTVHGGRVSVTTANDGGEGLESKDFLTINGGLIELQCYDDAINSGGDLAINGGWIYAGASGNDAIDSNGSIYMTGGVVLAISTAGAPEVAIDTDNSSGFIVSGGHLVAVGGAAGNMVIGSSGSQKTYKNASASASSYSGKYLSMTGNETFTVKMPSLSGTISLVCTTEGWTSAKTPSVSSSAPSSGATGFHDVYLSSYSSSSGGGTTVADLDSIAASYGPYRVGVKVYEPLAGVADGCTASRLPRGLKFSKKTVVDRKYGFGTIPAYTLYGVPSKAGSFTSVFKKSTQKTTVSIQVDAIDDWAKGAFNGVETDDSGNISGLVPSATVSAAGKMSGTLSSEGVKYKLASVAFDSYDSSSRTYSGTMTVKKGSSATTESFTVRPETISVSGGATIERGVLSSDGGVSAWQNAWKTSALKPLAASLSGTSRILYVGTDGSVTAAEPENSAGTIELKIRTAGKINAKGKFAYINKKTGAEAVYSVSCQTTAIPDADGNVSAFVYFPPKSNSRMDFAGFAAEIPVGE